jgi:hypothetical protein
VITGGLPVTNNNIPLACRSLLGQGPRNLITCVSAHGYRGYITYQPARLAAKRPTKPALLPSAASRPHCPSIPK